mgnify:CR=1 FL=1
MGSSAMCLGAPGTSRSSEAPEGQREPGSSVAASGAAADADAVLVTQIASQASTMGVRAANPEVTRNITPTYYFNVWEVEVTEYIEPPSMEVKSDLVLATQLYQVSDQQPVWAIESRGTIVKDVRRPGYFEFIVKEAAAIAQAMQRDGVVR